MLGRIAVGKPPLPDGAVHTLANGQVTVDAFPITWADKTLFSSWGYHAQVWMQPGVTAQQVRADAARAYRGDGFENPGVALALERATPPKLNHRQEAHLVALFDSGDHSTAELVDLFGVTRSAVYRAVERERARASLGVGVTAG